MRIEISNSTLTVIDPSSDMVDFVSTNLVYTDKSKQYQLKRMAGNSWRRNSKFFQDLKDQIKGQLWTERSDGALELSSCFSDLILKEFSTLQVNDLRNETGKTVALPWVKKPYDLRDYQEEAVQLMLSNPRGIINFATGLGKTLLATHMVKHYRKRSLIVCPSESVAKQFYEQFVECFGKVKVGYYGGGKKQISEITIGIAASVTKGIKDFAAADLGLVIFDETHHTPATTFFDISQGLSGVGKVFGLTATDFRSDGKDIMITAGAGPVLIRRDISWGVANGWLAEPYFIVQNVPTVGKDFPGDKLKSYKAHVLGSDIMKQKIEDDCRRMIMAGKKVLCLVDEVAHGQELSDKLGIPFATGLDKKSQEYVDQLNAGSIPGLIGTDSKVGEGTDTQNVDVLILANFVASKGPVIQAVGRGLRKQGTKTKCLVLDYIPQGSTMLSRHAMNRIKFYKEITKKVKIV